LKVTPEIKQRLEEEARKGGRTQSQQAELMIERAFEEADRAGGPTILGYTNMIMGAFLQGGQRAAVALGHPAWKPEEWVHDPQCFRTAAFAVGQALGLPLERKAEMSDPDAVRDLLTGMLAAGFPFKITREGEDK
jgi:hypothetical protein